MGAEPACMHDALGDALVIKVEDLLAEMKILKCRRPAASDSQRILVVSDRSSLLGRQDRDVASRHLMRLTALTANDCLAAKGCGLAFAVSLAATSRTLRHVCFPKRLGRSLPAHAHGERRAARSVACLWHFAASRLRKRSRPRRAWRRIVRRQVEGGWVAFAWACLRTQRVSSSC